MKNAQPQDLIAGKKGAPTARRARPRALWILAVPVTVLVAGFFIFADSVERQAREPLKRAEAMVAFTGGHDRIADAIGLLAQGYAHRLLISGVNQGLSHSDIAQLVPHYRDLVTCCVDLGYDARNTTENALEAQRWFIRNRLHGPLLVVTSNYHMPRALAELEHALPGVELVPAAVLPSDHRNQGWWQNPHSAKLLAVEYAKYLASRVRMVMRRTQADGQAKIAVY